MTDFTGYDPTKEDREFLHTLTGAEDVMRLVGQYEEQSLDPRKLIRVENQKQMGSCQGHSLSSNLEWVYCIATGGDIVQLSRMGAYILSQDVSNIRTDSGSTVTGGIRVALQTGLPEELLWPYPQSYTRQKPSNNWQENAAKYKITRAVEITTFEQWQTWLGSGQGGIHTGISWGGSMNRAVVETFVPGGGGHSVAALCLSKRKDANGSCYSWIANSWSESFGNNGWQEWSPTAIRQMLRHQFTTFVGVSDMPNVKPRKLSVSEWQRGLQV